MSEDRNGGRAKQGRNGERCRSRSDVDTIGDVTTHHRNHAHGTRQHRQPLPHFAGPARAAHTTDGMLISETRSNDRLGGGVVHWTNAPMHSLRAGSPSVLRLGTNQERLPAGLPGPACGWQGPLEGTKGDTTLRGNTSSGGGAGEEERPWAPWTVPGDRPGSTLGQPPMAKMAVSVSGAHLSSNRPSGRRRKPARKGIETCERNVRGTIDGQSALQKLPPPCNPSDPAKNKRANDERPRRFHHHKTNPRSGQAALMAKDRRRGMADDCALHPTTQQHSRQRTGADEARTGLP